MLVLELALREHLQRKTRDEGKEWNTDDTDETVNYEKIKTIIA